MFFFAIFDVMILKKEITIIGTGSLAYALGKSLSMCGYSFTIIGRSKKHAEKLAGKISGKAYSLAEAQEKDFRNIIFLAVRDNAISEVVQELWKKCQSLKGMFIFHLSGSLTSEVLQPLKMLGAHVASFHPLQTFTKIQREENLFLGITAALEGDQQAVTVGKRIARALGAKPLQILSHNKVLYHTAGIFASNYLTTLLSVVHDIAVEAKIPTTKIWKMYLPLIQTTLANVVRTSPEKALTGPISRGDTATVNNHLRALSKKNLKRFVPLYNALGIETARLAKKKFHAG